VAYRQYTRCVEPADWKPRSYVVITLQSLILAPFATLIALVAGEPQCLWFLAEIIPLSWVIAYCRHFLYHRLVCLGGDRDAIGAIISISPPSGVVFLSDWDNDYSINLLLQNTWFGVTQAEAQGTPPFGYLIAPQPAITNPPVSQETAGHCSDDDATQTRSANLHSEFEGAGNYNLLQISQAMLAFAIGALAACLFLPWPADVIVSIGLAILAALGWLVGAILSKYVQEGNPSDVDPNIGTLEENDGPGEDGLGTGASIVYVQGTWVFDPLHEGWNEIHPIKVCTIVGEWDGTWSDRPPDVIDRLRDAFEVAQADETKEEQSRPEHRWEVHPAIDGCDPNVIE
jgi:hypothetical protein